MNKFSTKSKERLSTCHPDLRKIMNKAIKWSVIDFGIAEGHRSIKDQQKYFKEGKSKIDGINKKGKHNYDPSEAVDIFAYYSGKAQWDRASLSYIAGIIQAAAIVLLKRKKITHKVRWGGNWDGDGIILLDQVFDDGPHHEIID